MKRYFVILILNDKTHHNDKIHCRQNTKNDAPLSLKTGSSNRRKPATQCTVNNEKNILDSLNDEQLNSAFLYMEQKLCRTVCELGHSHWDVWTQIQTNSWIKNDGREKTAALEAAVGQRRMDLFRDACLWLKNVLELDMDVHLSTVSQIRPDSSNEEMWCDRWAQCDCVLAAAGYESLTDNWGLIHSLRLSFCLVFIIAAYYLYNIYALSIFFCSSKLSTHSSFLTVTSSFSLEICLSLMNQFPPQTCFSLTQKHTCATTHANRHVFVTCSFRKKQRAFDREVTTSASNNGLSVSLQTHTHTHTLTEKHYL